jgi:hypothetical protein
MLQLCLAKSSDFCSGTLANFAFTPISRIRARKIDRGEQSTECTKSEPPPAAIVVGLRWAPQANFGYEPHETIGERVRSSKGA